MNIIIKVKNLELTEYLEKLINQKIEKLEKFLNSPDQEVFVEVEKESNHHKKGDIYCAEIIISLTGKKLIAKAQEADLQKAIMQSREEMEIEIKRYKLKKIELPRREAKKSRKEIF